MIRDGRVIVDRHNRWSALTSDPERSRLAQLVPMEELASGEQAAVKWMREQEQMDDDLAWQQRLEREGGV